MAKKGTLDFLLMFIKTNKLSIIEKYRLKDSKLYTGSEICFHNFDTTTKGATTTDGCRELRMTLKEFKVPSSRRHICDCCISG